MNEPYLRVFRDRSELILPDGATQVFLEGSMSQLASLDKQYVTPVLRKYDLLRLNADGFMMTRSLAENYPYSPLYKANIRGARQEWLNLVEEVETNKISPEAALHYLPFLREKAPVIAVSARHLY